MVRRRGERKKRAEPREQRWRAVTGFGLQPMAVSTTDRALDPLHLTPASILRQADSCDLL